MDFDTVIYRAEYKCKECFHEEKRVYRYSEDVKWHLPCPEGCHNGNPFNHSWPAEMECYVYEHSVFELLSKVLGIE